MQGDSLLACFLFSRPTSPDAGCRRLLFLGVHAGLKGIHQIDHVWRRPLLGGLDLFAGFFLLEQVSESVFVSILELLRIEVTRLGIDDVTGKIEHFFGQL